MSKAELMLFVDFIGGSYLWAGVPADVFVTLRTTQQVRRDKMKTRCSNWKHPPLEKTLPFTGAQIPSLQISKLEGDAKKNGYYHSLP